MTRRTQWLLVVLTWVAHAEPTILKLYQPPRKTKAKPKPATTSQGLRPKEEPSDAHADAIPTPTRTETKPIPDPPSSTPTTNPNSNSRAQERSARNMKIQSIRNKPVFPPAAIAPVVLTNIFASCKTNRFLVAGVLAVTAVTTKAFRSEAVRRAFYFWRRASPIVGHYLFTQWWLQCTRADQEKRDFVYAQLHTRYCQPTMDIIANLRGMYAKIGQILSARQDILPVQYVTLFETLHDVIPQWPIETIQEIVSKALENEFGLTWDDVFESMDAQALGSASIGQVHRAVLKEATETTLRKTTGYSGGNVVAVKVMHPGAEERFAHDLQVFRWLRRMALPDWTSTLDELERRMMTEFDYREEAKALAQVRANMAQSPYWDRVCVPEPLESLCCKEVLVMEMLNGPKLINAIEDDVVRAFGDREKGADFIAQRKQDVLTGKSADIKSSLHSVGPIGQIMLRSLVKRCRRYIKLLVDVHGKQIFVDGCFNGDPHFGNVLLLDDGRLGLIDYGQTQRLTDNERIGMAKVVACLSQECDDATIASAMRELGFSVEREPDDAMMVKYANIFFDSDQEGSDLGFATPSLYFSSLTAENPLTSIPDAASKLFCAPVCRRGWSTQHAGYFAKRFSPFLLQFMLHESAFSFVEWVLPLEAAKFARVNGGGDMLTKLLWMPAISRIETHTVCTGSTCGQFP
jgi:aarF domain-containing kinase